MAKICPDDGSALEEKVIHGLDVDLCPKCGGLWLDRGEIVRMRSLKPEEVKDFEVMPKPLAARSSNPLCPVCSKPLHPYQYAGGKATLETCEELHGIWVPESELDSIAAMATPSPEAQVAIEGLEALAKEEAERHRRVFDVLVAFDRHFGWPMFYPGLPQPLDRETFDQIHDEEKSF